MKTTKKVLSILVIAGVGTITAMGCSPDAADCKADSDCKGSRVCSNGVCVDPMMAGTDASTDTDGGTTTDSGGPSDSGVMSNCVQTTFKITNWPGMAYSNSFYTGTSWMLKNCTEIQSDLLTITIKCPKDMATGNTDFISEGCGVLGAAAPGNVLTDKGANPSSGTKCAGQVVTNKTITCYQQCSKLLQFQITSGPCD